MKITGFIILLLSFSDCLFSQTQGAAYEVVGKGVATTFVTDYHSLGINNSALGWGTGFEGKKITMGMTEFNMGIYSDSLNVEKLRKLYKAVQSDITGKNQDPAQWEDQRQYASEYVRSGIALDASYNWFGFAFQSEKFGGIALNVQEQYNWYSRLNNETTDLIFHGKFADYFDTLTVVYGSDTSRIANYDNMSEDSLSHVIAGTISIPLMLSQITNGSEVKASWNRFYNFGYGRKLIGNDSTFAVYAGIGGRFIQSMAMFSMESTNSGMYMYSSITPNYDIDYGSVATTNVSNFTKTGKIPKAVGNGYGIDLSVSVKLLGRIKLAAAVNNLGSVKYTRNVYKINDSIVGEMTLNGLENYNITNSLKQFLNTGGILSLQGQEEYVLKNAANVRFGGSIDFGKLISVGMDVVAPFDASNPGSIVSPVYSFGGHIRPVKWLYLSAGYLGGGIYKNNIPMGINFVLKDGAYEFGVSSRDALSFFLDNSNSISAAFGFARVRF